MRHSRSMFFLILTLLPGIALAKPAQAADQVPFKGIFVPHITVVGAGPGCDPAQNQVFATVWVTGQATHLGNFVGPATFCLDQDTLCYTGEFQWFSPNGKDSVKGTFTGCFVPDPPGSCTARNVELVLITGGTGRFAGATGRFEAGGVFNLCTLAPAPAPFTGTVSRPSKK